MVDSAVRVATVVRWAARVWRSWTPVAVTVRLRYMRLDHVCATVGTAAFTGAGAAVAPAATAASAAATIAAATDRRVRTGS